MANRSEPRFVDGLQEINLQWTEDEFNNFWIDLWQHEQELKNKKESSPKAVWGEPVTVTINSNHHYGGSLLVR